MDFYYYFLHFWEQDAQLPVHPFFFTRFHILAAKKSNRAMRAMTVISIHVI